MIHLALFASGSGSNAENLARYFATHPSIRVKHILTNNPVAGVIERARDLDIPCTVFSRDDLGPDSKLPALLNRESIHFLILAGFLKMVPPVLLRAFPDRILNIHPALLPLYGGKGMYGKHVHEAVLRDRQTESGITIHLVNAQYDEGRILFQARCPVLPSDTPESLAERIHVLEYRHFPLVVEDYVLSLEALLPGLNNHP